MRAAAQQPDAGASPDHAQAGRSAVEHDFAEHGEQNLRRAAAGGPADVDHEQPQDQRHGAHIAQPFAVFVPGPHHVGFGERRGGGAESAARQKQPRDAQRRNQKRKRVAREGPLIAERRYAGAAQKRADGERGPAGGLGERIGGVQFLAGGDGRQNGGAPAGEKRRGNHQQSAQHVQQPRAVAAHREDEAAPPPRGSGRSRS